MMRSDAKVEKVYLYRKPVDFRKSINGLTALVEQDIKVAVFDPFDPLLLVFLNKSGNRVKILYWERNGFCLGLKRLESERFETSPDPTDEAIVLSVQELNWLLDGFDLWRNRPYQVLTPRYVSLPGIIRVMISLPDDFPDDPVLLKQWPLEALNRQEQTPSLIVSAPLTIQSAYLIPDAVLPISFWSLPTMMRPDAKVEKCASTQARRLPKIQYFSRGSTSDCCSNGPLTLQAASSLMAFQARSLFEAAMLFRVCQLVVLSISPWIHHSSTQVFLPTQRSSSR